MDVVSGNIEGPVCTAEVSTDEVAVDGAVVDGRRSFHEVADDGRDVLRYFDDDEGRVASRRGCRSCRNT